MHWVNTSGHTGAERTPGSFVGATRGSSRKVLNFAAFTDASGPRQATAPVCSVAQLPSADNVIHSSAGIAHVLLALSEGQLIDWAEDKNMVSAEVHRTPLVAVADRIVAVVIVVSVGKGVMRNKLQALREPLLDFHLKSVIGTGGIVSVIVPQIEWDFGVERAALVLRKEWREIVACD